MERKKHNFIRFSVLSIATLKYRADLYQCMSASTWRQFYREYKTLFVRSFFTLVESRTPSHVCVSVFHTSYISLSPFQNDYDILFEGINPVPFSHTYMMQCRTRWTAVHGGPSWYLSWQAQAALISQQGRVQQPRHNLFPEIDFDWNDNIDNLVGHRNNVHPVKLCELSGRDYDI